MENYEHIDLTEEETAEGILWAKVRKELRQEDEQRQRRQEENRKFLFGEQWNYTRTLLYMENRAGQLFKGKFVLDEHNEKVIHLLCMYFANDPRFIDMALDLEVHDPSLSKGIFLAGSVGVGKTWLMKLFSKNQRQTFAVMNVKDIIQRFAKDGDDGIMPYLSPFQLPEGDTDNFYQRQQGLCLDDLGTEEVQVYYGNRRNVIGDILEERYNRGHTGTLLHLTTNYNMDQVKNFYGSRVTSRLREVVNVIYQTGNDRRK